MSFQGHYIGYGELEKMVEATSGCGHIFANCIVESSPSQMGLENYITFVQVARIDREMIHYWRWKIAVVLMIVPRQPMDDEVARRANASIDGRGGYLLHPLPFLVLNRVCRRRYSYLGAGLLLVNRFWENERITKWRA